MPKQSSGNESLTVLNALDRLLKTRIAEDEAVVAKGKRPFSKMTLAILNEAYAKTLRYYIHLLGDGARNPATEKVISGLWKETGRMIRHHDPALSSRLTARDGFLSQESTWSPPTIQKAWLVLNSIRVSANIMNPDKKALQRWSMLARE